VDIALSYLPILNGSMEVPPSKSYSQRAIALALLVDQIAIYNLGQSDDENAALEIIQSCNVSIERIENGWRMTNKFDFNSDLEINCHESGLSARLFSILLALNNGKVLVKGTGSLLRRDLKPIRDFYTAIQGDFYSEDNRLPLRMKGKRTECDITMDGASGSQHITGILYYLVGLRSKKKLSLTILTPTSIPYINMSIEYLTMIGANVGWIGENIIEIEPVPRVG
jgi:3-phosphoshikimate 1-carboxyvinyltransferase